MGLKAAKLAELWEWAEYYCPWSYIAAVRLQRIMPEYTGRVKLRERAFPLEFYGGGPPDRRELELEMWLAALQEPAAAFSAFKGDDWPATTMPAFEVAWCASQQGEAIGHEFDLRIRRAFFADGRNIGLRDVMLELAVEAGLDIQRINYLLDNGEARAAVLEEGRLGRERYAVRSTPTIMMNDGKKLHHPLAYPTIEQGRILSAGRLPCCGEGCYQATRAMFEQALQQSRPGNDEMSPLTPDGV